MADPESYYYYYFFLTNWGRVESTPSSGRPKPPVWRRLCANLHKYMCVYECESMSGRKITFTEFRTFLRRQYHSHNIQYSLWTYLHSSQSFLLSPGKPWVFFLRSSMSSKNHLLKWSRRNSLLHWMYEINVKKSIYELVVTALHRLFHYFFSRHLDIIKPRPKSSHAAPLKLDHRFVVSTVTLIPGCNIFVLSTDVIKWFYHRKKNPKADLSSGFNDGKFIFPTQLIKPIFLFQSCPYQRIQDSPKTFAQLPLTIRVSVALDA